MEVEQTKTLSDAICEFLKSKAGEADAAEIIAHIVPAMRTTADGVRQELQRMFNRKALTRPQTGRYRIAESKTSTKRQEGNASGDAAIVITNPVTGEPWIELVVQISFGSRVVSPVTVGSSVKGMQLKFKNDLNED